MKLLLLVAIFCAICFLLDARKRPKPGKPKPVKPQPALPCTGTNGKIISVGEGYKVGCLEYKCGQNGNLIVDINPTCCLYEGNYYQVDEVVKEILYGENCVLEQMVCKPIKGVLDNGQIVKEPVYGKCNCNYNGNVVMEGENVTLLTGVKASCCSGLMVTPVNKTSNNPGVKLVGGIKPGMGDVYLNDIPVGDCNWDKQSASVLCQDLGFGDAIEIPQREKKFSNHLSNFSIACNGDEASFDKCKISDDCNTNGVASVRCSRVKIKDNGQVFVDGNPICMDGLKQKEVTALCRELGYSTGLVAATDSGIFWTLKKLRCQGHLLSECTLSECNKNSSLVTLTCSHKMDVQLFGGNGENEGNIYFRGGPVCDDGFNITDADVICRELGFDQAEKALSKSHFGLVDLPFALDNVNCQGNEDKLSHCEAVGPKESNCNENEGAGVVCAMNSHSRKKRNAATVLQAVDTGSKIVGSVMDYFAEKEKQHQAYLKERPEKVDLGSNKLSIKMKPQKGYLDPSGEFNPGGFDLDIGTPIPPQKETNDGGPAFTYSHGIGPMLMNGCFGSNYQVGDPCYASLEPSPHCTDMIESANYVGVGFDGTGEYTHASRKKSLIQRQCITKKSYHNEDVPDSMNIFGIYDTACTGRSFNSLEARSEFQRQQSDMGSNEDLLRYKGGSHTSVNGGLGFGSGSLSVSHNSYGNKETQYKSTRRSKSKAESDDETTRKQIFEFTCSIRRYNIFLDEVTPSMLSSAFLEDYMNLPIRYYDFRQQAPLKYSRFLQRWGTHYIKSASFGGKFTLLRESRMHVSETKTEWQERVQEDTSQMFESKRSSVNANAEYSIWSASASATVDTSNEQTSQTSAQSSNNEKETNAKSKEATSYGMDDIIVEGGDHKVASILADKHRSSFKAEFRDWLESIPKYPKGYDFMFGDLTELLNINYRSLLNNKFEPCWKIFDRYDFIDDSGDLVCEKCLYNTTVKSDNGDEIVEIRKCQFQNPNDFEEKMKRKLLSLKRAIDIFVKNGGRSTTEVTIPGGNSQCENHDITYNKISYKELINGETYRVKFDLREDIGEEIQKAETMYISFKHDDDDGEEKIGRWAVDDSASDAFAGQYSKKIKADEASKIILINGVQFSYESGKSGNYLMMTETDCAKNKKRITSMAHQLCDEDNDLYWINVPLATIHPMKTPNTFYPCYLEWSNTNMLMSESSCVRFTATSEGAIYFALSPIPNRPDKMYYLRISPTDVTIYKNSFLMDTKTTEISAVGLGHKNIFQSYIICSEHEQEKGDQDRYTRITYGKLGADETIKKDATLNAYLIMKDDDSPIEPTYFAFGSGEKKVQIVDLELLDLPIRSNIKCRGDTIPSNGECIQACKISHIAEISKQTVTVQCYKPGEHSDEEYGNSTSHVGEESYCVAKCPNGKVAYPMRSTCKGDSTWSNKLNCYKECDKNDAVIAKGQLLIDNTKEEFNNLLDVSMDCSKEFAGLIIKDIKCNISCGLDQFGFEYKPIGEIQCSQDSKWLIDSKEVEHVCRSKACSAITTVPAVKCYQKGSDEEQNNSTSNIEVGNYCVAVCPEGEVSYPSRTECKEDSTWSHQLKCHKQCNKSDTTITKGEIVINNSRKEFKDLLNVKMNCSQEYGGLIIKGVKCKISCEMDKFGFKYEPIGDVECSDNSKWQMNSGDVEHVCRSKACAAITTVPAVKCFEEDSGEQYKNSSSHIKLGSYCLAKCPEGEVAYPSKTVCEEDSSWSEELKCHKQCYKDDPAIAKGQLFIGRKKELKKLIDLKINCSNDFDGLIIQGVRCVITCGTDEYGFEYSPIGDVECSNNSTWRVNYKENVHVCNSIPCSAIKNVSNGKFNCDVQKDLSMCTGDYYENGRPPQGTKCSTDCIVETGKWGSSWCYTEGRANWGAECVKCSGHGYITEGANCTLESCNEKYTKEEPSTVTCKEGEWLHAAKVEALQCIPTDKTCPPNIPTVKHGTVSCDNKDKTNNGKYLGGTICNVKCDDSSGFRPEDESSSFIQCIKGVWSVKAVCINTCPDHLPTIDHGSGLCNADDKAESGQYLHGTSCNINCQSNYVLEEAGLKFKCIDGDWSTEAVCMEKPCPTNLATVDHGTVSCTGGEMADSNNYLHGKKCNVQCNNGYKMEGANSNIQCVFGKWSKPVCIDHSCSITKRPTVANAGVSCSDTDKANSKEYLHGTSCNVNCHGGYKLKDANAKVKCDNGQWSTTAVCIDHSCPVSRVPTVSHAGVSCSDKDKANSGEYLHGASCNVNCHGGYKLKDANAKVKCDNGQWSTTAVCIDHSCPVSKVPTITNAGVSCSDKDKANSGEYSHGTSCNVNCRWGYKLKDANAKVKCMSGQWSTKAVCIEKSCPTNMPTINHGAVSCSAGGKDGSGQYLHGKNCNVYCKSGYKVKDANSLVQCIKGQWSTTALCIEKSCPTNLPAINHGVVSCSAGGKDGSGEYLHGTTCNVDCVTGYNLKDANSITQCIKGQWYTTAVCEVSPGPVYFIAGGSGAVRDISVYHPTVDNVACSILPPTLNNDWYWHSTFYHDNTIYMCGGQYTASTCISHNKDTEGWKTHTLTTSRKYHSSVVLHNRVYFIGGKDSSWNFPGAESTPLPLTDTPVLTTEHNLDFKGRGQCTAKIDEDTLVVTGGSDDSSYLTTVATYNVRTRKYTQLPSLKQPRGYHGCGVLERGDTKWIIVAGGDGDDGQLQSTEMLQLGGSHWTLMGNLNVARFGPSMAVTQRGVMVMGGWGGSNKLSSVELLDWDSAGKTWSVVQPSLNKPRYAFGGAVEITASMFGCTV